MAERKKSWAAWVGRLLTDPHDTLTRWERTVRYGYELARYGARQLNEDQAPQMAAALAYRSLFALLPVVVVSTVIVKGVKGVGQFQELIDWLVKAMGLNVVQIPAQAADSAGSTGMVGLGEWLRGLISTLSQVSLEKLGWIGLAVVIYSAIAVMVTIENSFNSICRAPRGRSWTRRVPLYFFILQMSPVAIGAIVYADALVGRWIGEVGAWNWLLISLGIVWNMLIAWTAVFVVYKLVPNTNLGFRATAIGALVAALLLFVGKNLLGLYFQRAFAFSYLYGTLGLIPVFMFWIYLMWLVVLFGLEVAAILQATGARRIEDFHPKPPPCGIVDPAAVLAVMKVIGERFQLGVPMRQGEIGPETGIPADIAQRIVERLVSAGFLHRLDRGDNAVTLARPPEQIAGDDLIELGFELADEGAKGQRLPLIKRLRDAQKELAAHATLATLAPAVAGRSVKPAS